MARGQSLGERQRAANPDVAQALLEQHGCEGRGGDARERSADGIVEGGGFDGSHAPIVAKPDNPPPPSPHRHVARPRHRPRQPPSSHRRGRRGRRHPARRARLLRQAHRQGRARLPRFAARPPRRQAGARHGDQSDARRRRQDDDDDRPGRRPQPHRQARRDRAARAFAGTGVRRQGRRDRRRPLAGDADGADQPALHGRLPRHHVGAQPARRAGRQPRLLGQRARDRHPPHRLAPRRRHERPGAARGHGRLGRRLGSGSERLRARERLRHHGGVGSDGVPLPRRRPRRSRAAARPHRRRLHAALAAGDRRRAAGGGRDDRAAEGRDQAQPRADDRRIAGADPRRPVREHRARLQLGDRDARGAEARRVRDHRGRLRRRPRRREVLRHQVPPGRAEARRGGDRRDRARAEVQRRRGGRAS